MRLKTDMLKAFEKQRDNEVNLSTLEKIQEEITLVPLDLKSMNLPFNNAEALTSLKRYRLWTKNYAIMFQTRAKVLVDLLHQLCANFEDRLKNTYDFFRNFKRVLKKNLEGVSLTEEVFCSIKSLKKYIEDLDTDIKARLEELKEMREQLGVTEEKITAPTGYYGIAHTNIMIYLNCLSLLIHKIEKDKQGHHNLSFTFSVGESNPALQERLMLISCECLRKFALEVVVIKIFDIHRCVNERIEAGCNLAQRIIKANPEQFASYHFTKLTVRLSSLLEAPMKRYVKAKISLRPEIIIKDQDFKEFFSEKYIFKYPSATPLWVNSTQVQFDNPRTKELMPFVLLLDVNYDDISQSEC